MPNRIDEVRSEEGLTLRHEINVVANMTAAVEKRMDQVVDDLPDKMAKALREAVASLPMPSEEEREYLRLATRAAARREKLQQAVIDKTLTALVWFLLAGAATTLWILVKEYAVTHLHIGQPGPPKP